MEVVIKEYQDTFGIQARSNSKEDQRVQSAIQQVTPVFIWWGINVAKGVTFLLGLEKP